MGERGGLLGERAEEDLLDDEARRELVDLVRRVAALADAAPIDAALRALPADTLAGRALRAVLGPRYRYSMRYADGNLGLLAILEDVRPFGRPFDGTHMLFAYTPLEPGRTRVQPIYVARAGTGVRQRLQALAKVGVMARAYGLLRDEDGIIYDNIRFHPGALLDMDAPIARYVAYVNRLQASAWSRRVPAEHDRAGLTLVR